MTSHPDVHYGSCFLQSFRVLGFKWIILGCFLMDGFFSQLMLPFSSSIMASLFTRLTNLFTSWCPLLIHHKPSLILDLARVQFDLGFPWVMCQKLPKKIAGSYGLISDELFIILVRLNRFVPCTYFLFFCLSDLLDLLLLFA